MKDEYDVIVIGCGPGGSTAARYAREAGMSVLVLDRRQEIGLPVRCGEGIAKVWLDEIGMSPNDEWIAHNVIGARIIAPDGSSITLDESNAGNECGYVVHRHKFDQDLARMAAESGAEIKLKTHVSGLLIEEGQIVGVKARSFGEELELRSKVVIGADGFESQVGKWAGIDTSLEPKDINSCYQYTLVGCTIDPQFNHFYIGNDVAPGGYVWVFPKGKDIANVGIGVNLAKIKGKGQPKHYLEKFIEADAGLKNAEAIRETAGAISCCLPLDKTTSDGVILVGDSARHIDPLTGGGVVFACLGGKRAGEIAAKAVKIGDCSDRILREYDRLWRMDFEEQLLRNYLGKEKFLELSDETMNKLIDALQDVDMNQVTTLDILQAVADRYPELVEEFSNMLL